MECSDIEDGELYDHEESALKENEIEHYSENRVERKCSEVLRKRKQVGENIKEKSTTVGILSLHNIIKNISAGSTGHAKKNIMESEVSNAFSLLIDSNMFALEIKSSSSFS
ncbi:hypothetical protein M0804_002310 [Polistes exclamans]|nr:hypothetical protein M0804_002310 [Polistes exclamans]